MAADWPSVSMQIAALRELLLNGSGVEGGEWFSKVVNVGDCLFLKKERKKNWT